MDKKGVPFLFDLIPLQSNDDYFLALHKRPKQGVYFTRFVGYDEEKPFVRFLARYLAAAKAGGAYLSKPLANPTERETRQFYEAAPEPFALDRMLVNRQLGSWMHYLSPKSVFLLSESITAVLELLKRQGANDNILKNAYVKFMCWLRSSFTKAASRLGGGEAPKILYEGDISKYEVYMLRILSLAGCDVLYLHFVSDDSYLKYDKSSQFSRPVYGRLRVPPKIHFSAIDLEAVQRMEQRQKTFSQFESSVLTNSWMSGALEDCLLLSNSQRNTGGAPKICNLFVRWMGCDAEKDAYLNRLFSLRKRLAEAGRVVQVLDKKIDNPTNDEVARYKSVGYAGLDKRALLDALLQKFDAGPDKVRALLAQKAFLRAVENESDANLARLYNHCVRLLCWLTRFLSALYQNTAQDAPPLVLYYGEPTVHEVTLLCALADIGVDVLAVSSDTAADAVFASHPLAGKSRLVPLPQSMPLPPFPEREVKVRVATVAYNASRQLDELLYTDTELFRNRQFARSKPVTLKTTYEEIGILWHEEAKYRPSFSVEGQTVTVPNIFAKVCGVADGNVAAYWDTIRSMVTPETIVFTRVPLLPEHRMNAIRPYVDQFIRGGRINPSLIKKHSEYQYDYLNDDTQDYMLEKMQELLDLQWIETEEPGLPCKILATLLGLDGYLLRLIQNFDFTKKVPKLIIVDVDEKMFTLDDCILVSYFNLIGFDIVVFTPTGYRNLEKYIKRDVYELYNIGPYSYNLTIPNLREKQSGGAGGLFGKLFGKGRN